MHMLSNWFDLAKVSPLDYSLWIWRVYESDGARLRIMGATQQGNQPSQLHQHLGCCTFGTCSGWKHDHFPESWLMYLYLCNPWNYNSLKATVLRMTLLCMVIIAKHCYFVVEHPEGSLLRRHLRWETFCNSTCYVSWLYTRMTSQEIICLAGWPKLQYYVGNHLPATEVYTVRFWMMLLGAKTSKPTVCWSNGSWISGLDMGPLKKQVRQQQTSLKPVRSGPRDIQIDIVNFK